MASDTSRGAVRAGWAISALVAPVLVADGLTGLPMPATLAEPMRETGFPAGMIRVVGAAAIAAGVLHAIPRTAILGAILVTGFAGGAITTHVRIGTVLAPPQLFRLAIGVAAWAGLRLRDPRVRALLPAG